MKNLKQLLKNNALFFYGYMLLILVCTFVLFFFTKREGFYFLNSYHSPFLNYVFLFFTFLGDGLFIVSLSILFLILNKRKLCLLIISSYLLSGLIAQALKYFVIEARPALDKGLEGYNNFIENVTLHNNQGFPSGHSASAFALAAGLALYFTNKKLGLIFLLTAIAIGYSRIYLGQHFLIDVLAGSFIGVISGIICWLGLYKRTWLV